MKTSFYFATLLMAAFGASLPGASIIMPDFADAPAGWTVDRYAPDSFADIGTFEGREDVLGITISTDDGLSSRPAAYQSTFYNTQGMQYVLTGGAGSLLSAALYIPSAWTDPSDPGYGSYRTDMWGVMTDGSSVTDYPIIGFTNYGGAPRYRIWEENLDDWVDLDTPVQANSWTDFGILFTGTSYIYLINGTPVYTDTTVNGSTAFSAMIMQAYNFAGDPSISGAQARNYTAFWSNAAVPEPGCWAMFAGGLGLLVFRRRRRA